MVEWHTQAVGSPRSSMDDQERHYIGNLLCDDEVFTHSSPKNLETNTSPLCPPANVLPSSGPIGPPPNRTFWPEPPPPYSPSMISPPQWSGIGHQRNSLLREQFSQPPNPAAMGHNEFYQYAYSQPNEWNTGTILTPMDTYVTYPSQNAAMQQMMHSSPLDPIQQFHSMYGRNQQHHPQQQFGPFLAGQAMMNKPQMPATLPPAVYAEMEPSKAVGQFDTRALHQLQPIVNKTSSLPLQFDEISPTLFSMDHATSKTSTVGKLYSEATKNERAETISEPAPAVTNSSSAVQRTFTRLAAGKDASVRNVTTLLTGLSERHSNEDSAQSGTVKEQARELDAKEIDTSKTVDIRKGGNRRKKTKENTFQKITHKKSKSSKSTKSESRNAGGDGTKTVDASSRFNILQSLGAHVAIVETNANDGPRRRSASSVDLGRAAKLGNIEVEKRIEEVMEIQAKLAEIRNSEGCEIDRGKETRGSISSQQGLLKKLIGIPRELCSPTDNGETRKTRKQRSVLRKRQNSWAGHLNTVLMLVFGFMCRCLQWIVDLMTDISWQLWNVTLYMAAAVCENVSGNCSRVGHSFLERLRALRANMSIFNRKQLMWSTRQNESIGFGLNDNIQLPSTGEAAMERLLKYQGRDAYAVLGLRADCSEDDIRRHYKRQAMLVHPDKNRASGAEEAFKILSKAFETIGSSASRSKYTDEIKKTTSRKEDDAFESKECRELWESLRRKMEEARNAMYCDCGGKHTRVLIEDLRTSEARYCKKCERRHPAKHNDIWAETRFFGLSWVYYACLDGIIYDISQWAKCPSNRLKHLKANNHTVQYRLVTTTGTAAGGKGATKGQKRRKDELEDVSCIRCGADFEDDSECSCCSRLNHGKNAAGSIASQQASYRPPERGPFDDERPRRAGRRRKLR